MEDSLNTAPNRQNKSFIIAVLRIGKNSVLFSVQFFCFLFFLLFLYFGFLSCNNLDKYKIVLYKLKHHNIFISIAHLELEKTIISACMCVQYGGTLNVVVRSDE